jgi:hypothetical protein
MGEHADWPLKRWKRKSAIEVFKDYRTLDKLE